MLHITHMESALCRKNLTRFECYNSDVRILIIFGRNVAEKVSNQKMQLPHAKIVDKTSLG